MEAKTIDWQTQLQEDVADPMMALSTPSMSSWHEESGRLVELGSFQQTDGMIALSRHRWSRSAVRGS